MHFKQWLESTDVSSIKQAFERGIDHNDPKILGYHGTSIQTMRQIIKLGYIPITKGLENVFGSDYYNEDNPYGLHLVPNPKNKIIQSIKFRNPMTNDPYKDAVGWASSVSDKHYQFDKYGLDWSDTSHHNVADILQRRNLGLHRKDQEVLDKFKFNDPKDAVKGAIVLAISDDVAQKFKISMGGDGDDINIQTNALPAEYIIGIEPQDDYSYEWLDNI